MGNYIKVATFVKCLVGFILLVLNFSLMPALMDASNVSTNAGNLTIIFLTGLIITGTVYGVVRPRE